MIQISMYPSLTQDDYLDEDNKAYLEYLIYIMDVREGDDDAVAPSLDNVIVPSVPALRDVTHEELEEVFDGEIYYDALEQAQFM